MFYAVLVPPTCLLPEDEQKPEPEELVFDDIKLANAALKKYKGSRMKTYVFKEKALEFLQNPEIDESFVEDPSFDLSSALEKLSIEKPAHTFETVKPGELNQLRRRIESGDYDYVEETIWKNPRCLITVCDSAVYLMAGPKYNACHIAARSNKPDIMALLLDTVSNISFIRKLYPNETDENVQDRLNHLLDSYLNTPDPRQGNTPLHFACKLGHYRVVRVLLTYENCQLNLRDSLGKTAEESICAQKVSSGDAGGGDGDEVVKKLKDMFKNPKICSTPLHRDQLKKRLLLAKRRNKMDGNYDSDTSFSDDSFMFSPTKR